MKRTVVSSVSLTCLTSICPFQSQSSIIPLLYYVFSFPPPAFSWTISTDSYCFICLEWLHWNPKGDFNLQAESERVSEIITYNHHLVVTRLPQPTRTHNTYEYLNRKIKSHGGWVEGRETSGLTLQHSKLQESVTVSIQF